MHQNAVRHSFLESGRQKTEKSAKSTGLSVLIQANACEREIEKHTWQTRSSSSKLSPGFHVSTWPLRAKRTLLHDTSETFHTTVDSNNWHKKQPISCHVQILFITCTRRRQGESGEGEGEKRDAYLCRLASAGLEPRRRRARLPRSAQRLELGQFVRTFQQMRCLIRIRQHQ